MLKPRDDKAALQCHETARVCFMSGQDLQAWVVCSPLVGPYWAGKKFDCLNDGKEWRK